ncbi:hypothetical protein CY34DRAFT_485332 [Suillus luteus UH-Slu-Lm8-n1]|uniref:Unplaced genomic scaffold CY34scaffold_356, whole genome shotgun sequence n=1 Tax=Suillus luteus UH-Slu-Lm8-n1 TaxID=930992 RepID=A0A0C9ZHP4_9AGAM|nr:hypothetical protein CY34DRAFT_485332 [Suillus luteus UH-Slu-Lm8-n1]
MPYSVTIDRASNAYGRAECLPSPRITQHGCPSSIWAGGNYPQTLHSAQVRVTKNAALTQQYHIIWYG